MMSAPTNNPDIKYRRLPGRVWVPISAQRSGSIWLGPDHLLTVLENGYAENYKRFYLADIQGFIVRRNSRRMILNLAFGFILLCIFGITTMFTDAGFGLVVTVTGGGIFLLGMLINSLSGPTCEVRVRTAVQTEKLSPLQRIRSFEKFLNEVRPLIIQAQGELNPGEAGNMAVFAAPASQSGAPPPLKIFSPRLHLWFFGSLAATTVPGFLLFILPNPLIALSYYLFIVVGIVLGLAAAVRQHSEKCKDSALIALLWTGFGLVLLNSIVHYFELIFFQFDSAFLGKAGANAQWAILYIDPTQYDFIFWQISIFLFLAWGLGMFGFIRAWQLRPIAADTLPS